MSISTKDVLLNEEIKPASFESAMRELQSIVSQLDGGQLSLSESLECFERGTNLLKQCQNELDRAERKIETLTGFNALGQPVTEAFDATNTLDQREHKAGRRKSNIKKASSNQLDEPNEDTPKEKSLFM